MAYKSTTLGLLALLLAAAGCGGSEVPAPIDPLYTGADPLQGPPNHVVGDFQAQLPEYTMKPGEEAFPCWILPIEIEGPSRFVGGAKLEPSLGLHHGNVTSRPKTGEGIRPCDEQTSMGGSEALDIVSGGAWLFASSTQVQDTEWQTFPAGFAFPVKEGHEIVAHMHYLNATSEELVVAPKYTWYTIDESSLENLLAPFGLIFAGFKIPPKSTFTATGNCKLPEDKSFNILTLLPHMHALGTRFTAGFLGGERHGELFLDSKGYNPDDGVAVLYEPSVDLSIATGIQFSCTWNNHFDKEIVEGIGDNEMCMLFGYGYPHDQVYMGVAVNDEICSTIAVPPFDGE